MYKFLGGITKWFINVEYAKLNFGLITEFIAICTAMSDFIVLQIGKDIIAIQRKINPN